MTQHQLDQQISRATGDDLTTIRRQGFSLVEPPLTLNDDDREPLTVDWDALDSQRATHRFPA
ncbi:MAG: hypothetical protein SH850_10840 [Planctomycetaceae bacterium]|nr:hypothetical protein [Planctomycetaceae bacterium]